MLDLNVLDNAFLARDPVGAYLPREDAERAPPD